MSRGDPIRIRYDAATNQYQAKAGDRDWDRLIDDPSSSNPTGVSNSAIFESTATAANSSYFSQMVSPVSSTPEYFYRYSNLAAWAIRTGPSYTNAPGGEAAFGIVTPSGGIPTSGSGTYQGHLAGRASVIDDIEGEAFNMWVGGTVELRFDFAAGSLSGELRPRVEGWTRNITIPTLNFIDTIFGVGRTEFSGRFATSLAGPNGFSGRFTGPQAEELIGRWAFPFIDPLDGSTQSAEGAMVAKRQ